MPGKHGDITDFSIVLICTTESYFQQKDGEPN